jgi:hypothetical protein
MKRASAKERREARAQMRQVAFEAMANGFSIEEIADMRKVSPRTIRREVDRTLSERRLDAPERYIHFQVARLNKVVRVADAGLDRGELRAIAPMIKAVKALDRYHGLGAYSRAALLAPRAARLPPCPLRLSRAAAPSACHPRKNGGPEAAAAALQTERLNLDARFREHDTENDARAGGGEEAAETALCATAAAGESGFVTDLAAQTLEIMGRLPELQPARDDRGDPREAASALSACHPRESGGLEAAAATLRTQRLDLDARVRGHDTVSPVAAGDESDFVTDFAAQALEIMGRLPELQLAPEDGGDPGEAGPADEGAADASPGACAPGVGESEFVTDFAAQTLEIMGSLPELQPAPEGGRPREADDSAEGPSSPRTVILTVIRGAARGGAPQDEESCENRARPGSCFVTDSAAQTFESLPELQPVPVGGGEASTLRPHPEEPKNWVSRRMQPASGQNGEPNERAAAAAPAVRESWIDAPIFVTPAGWRRANIGMTVNGVAAG